MGFVWLGLIGAAAFVTLWRLGLARSIWSMAGAAMMLGATGYAWQGRPMLPGTAAVSRTATAKIDPAAIELREKLLGRFTADTAYLIASDAMARAGEPDAAANVVLGGIRAIPRSYVLWTALGTTLAARDGNQVSPAAQLAFDQAMRLAPKHPAPPFYAGMASIQAGEFERARPYWRHALELSPAGASYRKEIAMRLALLDRMIALPPGDR